MRRSWVVTGAGVLVAAVLVVLWQTREHAAPSLPSPAVSPRAEPVPPGGGPAPAPARESSSGAEPGTAPVSPEESAARRVRVEGRVSDEAGQPIADAEMRLHFSVKPPPIFRHYHGRELPPLTDEDGLFRVEDEGAGSVALHVFASGYAGQVVPFEPLEPGPTPLDVVLRPALPLSGTVVDASGQPISGVEMSLEGPLTQTGLPPDSTESDAQGHFQLEVAEPGAYVLILHQGGWLTTELSVTAPARGLRLVMSSGVHLAVEVVDEAGHPQRDAVVFALIDPPDNSGNPVRIVRGGRVLFERGARVEDINSLRRLTDGAGQVEFTGLKPGRYVVAAAVEVPGYVRTVRRLLELSTPGAQRVRLSLEPGLRLEGRVVDRSGKPLAGAEVRVAPLALADGSSNPQELEPERFIQLNVWRSARGTGLGLAAYFGDVPTRPPQTTGRDGRFVVESLAPGPHFVTAYKDGYGFAEDVEEHGTRASAGERDVRVVLDFLGEMRGRVVHADGSPVTDFTVNGTPYHDARGTLLVPVQEIGEQEVLIRAKGRTGVRRTVNVREGEVVELGTVVMREGREVRVLVLDARTSQPVETVGVDLFGVEPDLPPEPSRRELYSVPGYGEEPSGKAPPPEPGLPPGMVVMRHVEELPLLLKVGASGYEPAQVPLGARQREIQVRLQPIGPEPDGQ